MVVSPLPLQVCFDILLLLYLILNEHQINLPTLVVIQNLDNKVESIVNTSVDYQDSELLEDFEDLFEVHDILEDIKVEHERKLQAARAKQPKAEW